MQFAQSFIETIRFPSLTLFFWILGLKRWLVLFFAWETLCPQELPFPQFSHLNAIGEDYTNFEFKNQRLKRKAMLWIVHDGHYGNLPVW